MGLENTVQKEARAVSTPETRRQVFYIVGERRVLPHCEFAQGTENRYVCTHEKLDCLRVKAGTTLCLEPLGYLPDLRKVRERYARLVQLH